MALQEEGKEGGRGKEEGLDIQTGNTLGTIEDSQTKQETSVT